MKLVRRFVLAFVTLTALVSLLGAAEPRTNTVGGPSAATLVSVDESSDLASCVSWDIKELCCPGYCAAKKGSSWASADKMFQGCITGLGCKPDHTNGFLSCDCK